MATLIYADPGMPALWLGLAIAVQATLGRLLLDRMGVSGAFSQVGDLFHLLLHGGVLATLAAAPLTYLALRHLDGFWEQALAGQIAALLLGQFDGVLIFATLMLGWRNTDHPGCLARHLEIGLVLLALGLGAMLLSQPMLFGLPATPMRPYPLLPFLLWLALRADLRLLALALAWVYAVMAANREWGHWAAMMLPDGHLIRPLNGFITVVATSFLALGLLMATNRRLEQAQRVNALAQRDALIREVHHRIKNNLQIVVGLLRRDAARHPETGPMLESAINQVQAIAVVHGLHGRVTQSGVMLCELLPTICRTIADISGVSINVTGIAEGRGLLRIQESETVAMALILNELVSNAVKHRSAGAGQAGVSVSLSQEGDVGRVQIRNPGILAAEFDFARGKGLGTGLGLVRALLPTRGVDLDLHREGGMVVTEMRVAPPILLGRSARKEFT